MGWIKVKCPHCKKSSECQYDNFEPGPDHATYEDVECDHCHKEFGYEIVSDNIYVESVWKSEHNGVEDFPASDR